MFFSDGMRSFFLHLFLIEERASINQGGFMDKVIRVGPGHLPYLHPLVKWRVMDLRGLQDAAALGHGRKNFYRIINHLETQGMVKTWRDPFNKKKYAYLTPAGQALVLGFKQLVLRSSRRPFFMTSRCRNFSIM
jgi:hypothetical protein